MSSIVVRCVVVFFCALWSLPVANAASQEAASEPASKTSGQHRFESEIAAFEKWDRKNSWPRDAVLFVGSSSIRLWQTAEAFPNVSVINRGFGGSTIADVNHHFDRILPKYKPRAIVFYSGDNDIAAGRSPQQVFEDFQEFARKAHEDLPKTPIFFISIKPSIARQRLWPKMKEANTLIQRLSDFNSQVRFVDVARPMLGVRDAPRKNLFLDDGLHLNAAGYKIWNDTLAPFLGKEAVNTARE
jgi:lysophospholipase L1-like esterase